MNEQKKAQAQGLGLFSSILLLVVTQLELINQDVPPAGELHEI